MYTYGQGFHGTHMAENPLPLLAPYATVTQVQFQSCFVCSFRSSYKTIVLIKDTIFFRDSYCLPWLELYYYYC